MTWVLPWKEPGVEGREAGTGRGRKCFGPSGRGPAGGRGPERQGEGLGEGWGEGPGAAPGYPGGVPQMLTQSCWPTEGALGMPAG